MTSSSSTSDSTSNPSAVSPLGLLTTNLGGDVSAKIAQTGLLVYTGLLLRMLWLNPAGLFTYHPFLASLATVSFIQGVLVLQPTKSAQTKKVGLDLHQVFQFSGVGCLLAGSSVIFYNKWLNGANHLQSWHAISGALTTTALVSSVLGGSLMVFPSLARPIFGSEGKAKLFWKYHRMAGYSSLPLLIVTLFLGLQSRWVTKNASSAERAGMALGLVTAFVGVVRRVSVEKMGFAKAR